MSVDLPSSSTNYSFPVAMNSSDKNTAIRLEMVQTARQFLQNPRVQNTPIEEQKKFLHEKGLTDAEIQEAFASLPVSNQVQSYAQVPLQNGGGSRLLTACQSAVFISGASYMAYKFVRSWLLPKFFDIPDPAQEQIEFLQTQMNDLQNSSKFIMDSVMQTLETVSTQQEQLNRAIMLMSSGGSNLKGNDMEKLHTDIGIVKSLLLNQNQFPPIPDHSAFKSNAQTNGFARNAKNYQNEKTTEIHARTSSDAKEGGDETTA